MILLDTHVVIWLLLAPEQLSGKARKAILQARRTGETIACSPVSLYEIANAARRKRLLLNTSTEDFVAAVLARLELVPLTVAIAVRAAELPEPFHCDPMDRILAASAIEENCTLITHDEKIHRANVCKVLW